MNNETGKPKKTVNKKALKIGSISITTTAVVIAIFIVINLFVGELPSTATKFDLSARELFTISDETRAVLSRVDEDVRIYLLTQRGGEDPTIREMLERYHALNSHITWTTVDPVTNPAFLEQYTSETLSDNSLVVESARRSYVVDYYEIFQTEYTEEDYYYYYYYGQIPQGTPYYYGELQLTTAVDYVTRDDLPVLGTLEGHGETALSESYTSLVGDENVEIRALTLLNVDAVPADMTSILINIPTSDISAAEESMLADYLDRGGSVILVTGAVSWSESAMPNLAALAA
ncbi:MAG: Gldg family protein, partial [Clostridia bacterium]|nr:Gldg family protein [Clostridia bacterium]